MIIVDEGIPADSLEGLRKAGVEVILVGELASSLWFTMPDKQALSGIIQLDVWREYQTTGAGLNKMCIRDSLYAGYSVCA